MKIFALIFLLFQVYLTTFANAIGSNTQISNKKAPSYIDYPFDDKVERLPPWFVGHDLGRIFNALNTPPIEKKEFETTSEFLDRKSKHKQLQLYGTVDRESLLAFSFFVSEIHEKNQGLFKYDADSGEMYVVVANSALRSISHFGWLIGAGRTYIAGNAFGAKAKVDSYDYFSYFLDSTVRGTFNVPISREVAPVVKKSLRVLFVGKLREPFLTIDSTYVSPTISNPQAGKRISHEIKFKTLEVWLYDGYTGRIYSRYIQEP